MNYSQVTVDILQNPKYAGAIDSVSWLTNWIDSGFGMVITIVAFLIILVAMFKNVLAAAYCAYPKFWDRVDAAHKEVESMGWIQQFKDTFMTKDVNSGSFSNAIMRILPNIKSFTDFEGDTVRPKTYFIRAIPQMILCIVIGAFIYNGYYRDTAAKVVDFGSEMISRVLLEVDPIAVFDQFTGSAGRPVFASDGSEIPQQQLVNKIATTVYNAVIGEYNDIDGSDAKRALANTIEGKINTWVSELESINGTYVDGESWKSVLQVAITNGEVDISKINGISGNNGLVMQYALQFPISDLNLSSNINVGLPMYVRIRLNFEKKPTQSGKHAVDDLVWHIGSSGSASIAVGNNLSIKNTSASQVYTATPENGEGKLTFGIDFVSGSGNKQQQITNLSVSGGASQSGTWVLEGSGIPVTDSKNNTTHYIKYISFDGGGELSSASEQRTNIPWDATDLGVVVSASDTDTTKPEDGTDSEVE